MTRNLAAVLICTLSACCFRGHDGASSCASREDELVIAFEAAATAVHDRYRDRTPGDVDAAAYLAAARAYPLPRNLLDALAGIDLEAWTKPDCSGVMVIARCRDTHRAILYDDTETPSPVEGRHLLAHPEIVVPTRPAVAPSCPVPPRP